MKNSKHRVLILLAAWLLTASFAGAFQLLAKLPPTLVPVLVATLTVGASLALNYVGWLRLAVLSVSWRAIVAVHLVRFVGVYFLLLQQHGRLPLEFAQRAGWGDVVAAIGAVVLLSAPERLIPRAAFVAWNLFGAADLLVAVGTAGWLNRVRPGAMAEISQFPLTLVPLFIVPVLMATHVHLLRRGHHTRSGEFAPAAGI